MHRPSNLSPREEISAGRRSVGGPFRSPFFKSDGTPVQGTASTPSRRSTGGMLQDAYGEEAEETSQPAVLIDGSLRKPKDMGPLSTEVWLALSRTRVVKVVWPSSNISSGRQV